MAGDVEIPEYRDGFRLKQADRFGFLHIDLNSFFASVEQQLHPEWRNLPLAVVPTMADTTMCIAASYRGQGARHQDRNAGRRGEEEMPRHYPRRGIPHRVREVLAPHLRGGGAMLSRRPHPLDRRDGMPAPRP